MEVQFTPELETRLAQRASEEGQPLSKVVEDVVSRFFEEEDRFLASVKRGEDALESGKFLTHEQVGEKLKRFLNS